MSQQFAVRADHDRREYQIYDTRSQETVEVFKYKPGELHRGVAHGRANIRRRELNEKKQ